MSSAKGRLFSLGLNELRWQNLMKAVIDGIDANSVKQYNNQLGDNSDQQRELGWVSYQIRKVAGCACAENAGNVFPLSVTFLSSRLKKNPCVQAGVYDDR